MSPERMPTIRVIDDLSGPDGDTESTCQVALSEEDKDAGHQGSVYTLN